MQEALLKTQNVITSAAQKRGQGFKEDQIKSEEDDGTENEEENEDGVNQSTLR